MFEGRLEGVDELIETALSKVGFEDFEWDTELEDEIYLHLTKDNNHYWICWNLPEDDSFSPYVKGYTMRKTIFHDDRNYPDEQVDDLDNFKVIL